MWVLIFPPKNDSIYGIPTCKPSILSISRTRSLKGEEKTALGGWNCIWIFFLTFDYGNCWIWDKGNWPPLFSKVSFSGDLSCAAGLWRGKGSLFQLALWTMLTGLPPMQRHPPVTLIWHTLMSKPSLRLPSAGKPARIRKFQLPQLIRKTTFKSWREKGHVMNC